MDEEKEVLEQCTEELLSQETFVHTSVGSSVTGGVPFFQVFDDVFHAPFLPHLLSLTWFSYLV